MVVRKLRPWGERAATIYTLIITAKLNDIDPRAWLADTLCRIADHPASRLHELLPWNWNNAVGRSVVAAELEQILTEPIQASYPARG